MLIKRADVFIVVLSFILIGIPKVIYAEVDEDEKSFFVENGTYIEFFGVRNSVGGDFDNSSYLVTSSAVYDVPDVDPGMGFGFSLGIRDEKGVIEVSYQRSSHDTSSSFVDIGKQKGYLNAIDFNLKFDAFTKERIWPHILLGFGIPWLTIEDSMVDAYSCYDDETFFGISGNIGAGISYFLNPKTCITGGILYRWMMFSTVEGVNIDDDLSAGGPCFRLGLAFTF